MSCRLPVSATLFRLALVMVASGPAVAVVPFPARTSVATINTSSPDFSDVSATLTATVQIPAGASGTRNFTFYTGPSLATVSAVGSGGIEANASISYVDPDPVFGYKQVDGSATALDSSGGSLTLTETFTASTVPDGSPPLYRYGNGSVYQNPDYAYLPPFTRTDLPSIEYYLPFDGANLVDEGGSYTVKLMIAGDYSTTNGLNSGPGQHYLALLNPDFMITENFIYDPIANQTRFTAVNPNYSYEAEDPRVRLDVFFFGRPTAAAVPEPASWATMIAGFGLAGCALRMRRSRERFAAE